MTHGDHFGDAAEYGALPGDVGDWLKLGDVGEYPATGLVGLYSGDVGL